MANALRAYTNSPLKLNAVWYFSRPFPPPRGRVTVVFFNPRHRLPASNYYRASRRNSSLRATRYDFLIFRARGIRRNNVVLFRRRRTSYRRIRRTAQGRTILQNVYENRTCRFRTTVGGGGHDGLPFLNRYYGGARVPFVSRPRPFKTRTGSGRKVYAYDAKITPFIERVNNVAIETPYS